MTPAQIINGADLEGWQKIVIADDETRKATVYRNGSQALIGFYQTRGSKDWENNFRFWRKSYSVGSKKYKAHAGFVAEYLSLRGAILEAVKGCDFIKVYGFSQGGAHAILCTRDIIYNIPEAFTHTETFGAPRVYSWASAKEFDTVRLVRFSPSMINTVYQHRFHGDPVPHVPFKAMGYGDVGTIVYHGPWELPFNTEVHSMDEKYYGGV